MLSSGSPKLPLNQLLILLQRLLLVVVVLSVLTAKVQCTNTPQSPEDSEDPSSSSELQANPGPLNGMTNEDIRGQLSPEVLAGLARLSPEELGQLFGAREPLDSERLYNVEILYNDNGLQRAPLGRGNKALISKLPESQDIDFAVVNQVPAGTTDFRCFYWGSEARLDRKGRLPPGSVSTLFNDKIPMQKSFRRAEQLLCFDIAVDNGETILLFEEAENQMLENNELGGIFFANLALPHVNRPVSHFRGRTIPSARCSHCQLSLFRREM